MSQKKNKILRIWGSNFPCKKGEKHDSGPEKTKKHKHIRNLFWTGPIPGPDIRTGIPGVAGPERSTMYLLGGDPKPPPARAPRGHGPLNDGRHRCGFAAAVTDVREVHALHRSPTGALALRAGSSRGAIPVSGFQSGYPGKFLFFCRFFDENDVKKKNVTEKK